MFARNTSIVNHQLNFNVKKGLQVMQESWKILASCSFRCKKLEKLHSRKNSNFFSFCMKFQKNMLRNLLFMTEKNSLLAFFCLKYYIFLALITHFQTKVLKIYIYFSRWLVRAVKLDPGRGHGFTFRQ